MRDDGIGIDQNYVHIAKNASEETDPCYDGISPLAGTALREYVEGGERRRATAPASEYSARACAREGPEAKKIAGGALEERGNCWFGKGYRIRGPRRGVDRQWIWERNSAEVRGQIFRSGGMHDFRTDFSPPRYLRFHHGYYCSRRFILPRGPQLLKRLRRFLGCQRKIAKIPRPFRIFFMPASCCTFERFRTGFSWKCFTGWAHSRYRKLFDFFYRFTEGGGWEI